MKFVDIQKVSQGKFLTKYDIHYLTEKRNPKTYEMVSRNPNLKTQDDLHTGSADSVVMILTDESKQHILLTKEFRMALGCTVYGFPAGLIDPGETAAESAKRELWEETGLTLTSIERILPDSYNCVGITNEKSTCVFGTAAGEFRESTSDLEEIECHWYTKDEVKQLLETSSLSARVQLVCFYWANNN